MTYKVSSGTLSLYSLHTASLPGPGAMLDAYQKLDNDRRTSIHIAADPRQSASEKRHKGCSELSQTFAGVCGQERKKFLCQFSDCNLASEQLFNPLDYHAVLKAYHKLGNKPSTTAELRMSRGLTSHSTLYRSFRGRFL